MSVPADIVDLDTWRAVLAADRAERQRARRLEAEARTQEEKLRGPELLHIVRGRMEKGYPGKNVTIRINAARRDVWLLIREVERLVLEDQE